MLFSTVGAGERVLLVWADLGAEPGHLQTTVEQIQSSVGKHHIIEQSSQSSQSSSRGQIPHFICLSFINAPLDQPVMMRFLCDLSAF